MSIYFPKFCIGILSIFVKLTHFFFPLVVIWIRYPLILPLILEMFLFTQKLSVSPIEGCQEFTDSRKETANRIDNLPHLCYHYFDTLQQISIKHLDL